MKSLLNKLLANKLTLVLVLALMLTLLGVGVASVSAASPVPAFVPSTVPVRTAAVDVFRPTVDVASVAHEVVSHAVVHDFAGCQVVNGVMVEPGAV